MIGILGHLGNRTGQLPYAEKDNGEDMCEQKEADEVRWPQEDVLGDHSSTDTHREMQVWGVDRSVLPDFTVGSRKLSIRTER